jgi:predicted small integral membrane protein
VAIRYVKAALVAFISLMCLMYAAQNVANLQAAHFFVSAATSTAGHEAYPASFGPGLESPALAWLALAIILAGEITAGVLAARGAWALWAARSAGADAFNAAKRYANLGGGVALLVWFGLFTVVGGAYFQMWQTELGGGSLDGAFQFVTQIGIVLLFVNLKDRD